MARGNGGASRFDKAVDSFLLCRLLRSTKAGFHYRPPYLSMSYMQDLEDYKLQAEYDARLNVILHRSYRADWARGRQKVVVEERWAPQTPALGTGSFGTVRLELRQDTDDETQCRAVKQLRKADLARTRVDFRKELVALTKFSRSKFVQSQAFVKFLGWFEDDSHVYFAMEYFQHGTLDLFISEAMSEGEARIIAQQLLEGLRIMHGEHFTHRDLKPQNIFIVQHAPNWWVKIGDFGMSKRVAHTSTILQSKVGTPLYAAPEIFHYVPSLDEESDAYTSAVDIWSFACVLYEMLALHPPFINWPRRLVAYCRSGDFPSTPLLARASSVGIRFVQSVLVAHPAQRPTAASALESPWFQADLPTRLRPSSFLSLPTATRTLHTKSAETICSPYADSSTSPGVAAETEPASSLALRQSHPHPLQMDRVSASVGEPSKPNPRSTITAPRPLSYRKAVVPEGTATLRPQRSNSTTEPRLDSVDDKRNSLPSSCDNCTRTISGDHYHCSTCNEGNLNLCSSCVKSGRHCHGRDHWMLKRIVKDHHLSNSVTETLDSGWTLQSITGTTKQKPLPPIILSTDGRCSPYRKPRNNKVIYDYCWQCRITFPSDDPPPRHEGERHGTEDFPTRPVSSNKTASQDLPTETWMKQASPEEQAQHLTKMATMEAEMKMVFQQKVSEKEQKLKQSEEELYARHREMKDPFVRQRQELEEKIARIEAGRPAEEKKKKRKGFSLRG